MEGSLCYTEAWEMEDKQSGDSATRRTAKVLVAMMNDVFDFMNFTIGLLLAGLALGRLEPLDHAACFLLQLGAELLRDVLL